MRLYYRSDILAHHGILGQHWGKRNGPPYPLNAQSHSNSEKKAGWKKSLDKSSIKTYDRVDSSQEFSYEKKRLTKKQKAAIIGASAVVAGLAIFGGYQFYKNGRLDFLKRKGEEALAGSLGDIGHMLPEKASLVKSISEKLSDTLKNTNPNRGDRSYINNCSSCGIAAFLRSKGFNVTAKSTGGQMQNMGGVVEECFKNAKVFDGSAIKFGLSKKDASELLVHKFGQNADGICSIQFKGSGGHIFNWKISDGIVKFFDGQNGLDDKSCEAFWKLIDPSGALQIARLDNLEINTKGILKWIATK